MPDVIVNPAAALAKRVLIVEDDRSLADVYQDALHYLGLVARRN
jgi:hypothetical protein